MKIFYTIFICLSFAVSKGQINYTPYNYSNPDSLKLYNSYSTRLNIVYNNLSNREYAKDYKGIHSEISKNLRAKIQENDYVFDKELTAYFDFILNEICTSNQKYDCRNISLQIAKYPSENATCYNEGTIVFNMGLYRKLKDESQIAFIICHELAHYFLNHGNNAIKNYVKTINSDAYKKEVEEINDMEYNKRSRALHLFKDILYDDRYHSRTHENEADSLGIHLLLNTKYSAVKGIKALLILDSIEIDKYRVDINYKKVFDFKQYPFHEHLLEKEESIFEEVDELEYENIDSLKTHPDCIKRYSSVKKFLIMSDQKVNNLQEEGTLLHLQLHSDFEIINNYYLNKQYGKGLYFSLKLSQVYPNNLYLKKMVGVFFYHLSIARKNQEYGKYVELTASFPNEPYQEFLVFANNLRNTDLINMGFYFLENQYDENIKDQEFLYQLVLNSSLMNNHKKFDYYSAKYIKQFPSGKQTKYINQLIKQKRIIE